MSDEDYNYDYEGEQEGGGEDYVQEPIDGRNNYDALDEFYKDEEGGAPPDVSVDQDIGGGGPTAGDYSVNQSSGGGIGERIGKSLNLSVFGDKKLNLGIVKLSPQDIPLPFFDPQWFQKWLKGKDPWMVVVTLIETCLATFLSCANVITYIYMLIVAFVYTNTEWMYLILGLFFACGFSCCTPCLGCCLKYCPLFKANTSKTVFGQIFLVIYVIFNIISIIFYGWQAMGILGGTGFIQFNLFWVNGAYGQPAVAVLFGACWMFILCWCGLCLCTDVAILFYIIGKTTFFCAKPKVVGN